MLWITIETTSKVPDLGVYDYGDTVYELRGTYNILFYTVEDLFDGNIDESDHRIQIFEGCNVRFLFCLRAVFSCEVFSRSVNVQGLEIVYKGI